MNLRPFALLLLVTTAITCNAGDNGCAIQKPITNANVSTEMLQSFFGKIVSLCENHQMDGYIGLQTAYIRNELMSKLSPDRKRSLFMQHCKVILDAHRSIGGRPENGVHSIQAVEGRMTGCGLPLSYWYIHTVDGKGVFRLKLAFENEQIRINDH